MTSRTSTIRSFAFAVLLLPLAAAPTRAAAPAAPPLATVHEAFVPDLRAQDVETMIAALALDDLQQKLVRARFAEWDEAYVAGRNETRREMAALRPEVRADDAWRRALDESEAAMAEIVADAQARAERAEDPETRRAILEEAQRTIGEMRARLAEVGPAAGSSPQVDALMARMNEVAAAWMLRKAALRKAFLADVQALLTPEQAARWPGLERDLRRRREIGRGRLAGESVDLADLRATLVPDAAPAVLEVETAWTLALDAALVRRENVLDAALAGTEVDVDDVVRAHRAVRDANLEYAESLAAALGPDEGARFRAAFGQLAFPRAMRPLPSARILAQAAALSDLDAARRGELEALRRRQAKELAEHEAAIAQAILQDDPARLRRTLLGEPLGPPAERDLVAARTAWEQGILDALRAILGDERFARLAGPPPSPQARDAAALSEEQRELLRRFDANGDGRLDEVEKTALREWLRSRGG